MLNLARGMNDTLMNNTLIGQLSTDPVFGWWAVIPLAVIMMASLWLTLSSDGISLRARLVLSGLRLLAMAVLLLGWLRPGFITTVERESEGAIAVLLDRSESMKLPGDVASQNRWESQRDAWETINSATGNGDGSLTFVPYFFDRSLQRADLSADPQLKKAFSGNPAGRMTDLGKSLSQIGRQQLDPPLRGVMLITDATQTVIPPDVAPTSIARQMAQLDQPIVVVGMGQQGEVNRLKDVAIEGMPEYMTAFVKKEISIPMVIHTQGMQNQPVRVSLALRSGGKPDQVVASREVLASSPDEKLPVEFKILMPDEGEFLLIAKAEVDAREQIETNNESLAFITVREGGVKILYLEGQPRAEQLFLKRSLNESIDFDAQYIWFPEKERSRWPKEILNDVSLSDYDVFIIGDLDSAALTSATMQALSRRVNQGAGLLLLGGYHSFDAGGYGKTPLDRLIPIEMRGPQQKWDTAINPQLHIQEPINLKPTRPHPITNLVPEPDNTRLWQSLKPLQGMNRFFDLKSRPGTQVLLESDSQAPVLVTGEAGQGRILAFAGDTTYQWFLAGGDSGQQRVHQQFWRQAVLWLIRRDTLNEGFRLGLDKRRWEVDSTPTLSAEWFGGSENSPMPEQVKIELTRDGRWLRNLDSTTQGPNMRESEIIGLSEPGLYRATLTTTLPGPEEEPYKTDIAFIVRDESRELMQPYPDWQMMDNIVSANQAAGGKLFLPEDIGKAIEYFREKQQATQVTTVEKRRLGDAAWDAWLYLAIFCVVMSIEWGLRKSWQLP